MLSNCSVGELISKEILSWSNNVRSSSDLHEPPVRGEVGVVEGELRQIRLEFVLQQIHIANSVNCHSTSVFFVKVRS